MACVRIREWQGLCKCVGVAGRMLECGSGMAYVMDSLFPWYVMVFYHGLSWFTYFKTPWYLPWNTMAYFYKGFSSWRICFFYFRVYLLKFGASSM